MAWSHQLWETCANYDDFAVLSGKAKSEMVQASMISFTGFRTA
jgi:hypothetical protein